MGFELAHERWEWADRAPGAVGPRANDTVCGHLVHMKPNGTVWWHNGGIIHNKHNHKTGEHKTNFTFIGTEGNWRFDSAETSCLSGGDVIEIPMDMQKRYDDLWALWNPSP